MTGLQPQRIPGQSSKGLQFLRAFGEKLLATAGVRVLLGLSKWLVLLHGAKTLPTAQFAKLAAALSLAEILRVVADCGTESVVYARIRGAIAPIPRFIKASFQLRTIASISLALLVGGFCASTSGLGGELMLLGLVPLLSIESSALILLQRQFSRRRFAILVGTTVVAISIAITALAMNAVKSSALHASLILMPEAVVSAVAVLMIRDRFRTVFTASIPASLRALYAVRGLLAVSSLGAIVVIATSRLDVWIVMPMLGAAEQASYSAGLRFVEPANLLIAYASTAFLAELGVRGRSGVAEAARRLVNGPTLKRLFWLVLLQIVAGAMTGLSAKFIFGLPGTIASVAGLFGMLLPLRVISAILAATLYRLGRIDRVLIATIINLLSVVSLAVTLGPRLGVLWICTAAIIGEAASVIYQGRRVGELTQSPNRRLTSGGMG